MTVQEFRKAGEELNRMLILRYSPIAFKLIYSEDEIPKGSIRPSQKGGHLAMCQAFAKVKRERKAVTMLKEDHWCVWPLVGFRLIDEDEESIQTMGRFLFIKDKTQSVEFFRNEYPRVEGRRPIGFTLAPLESTDFEPDIVSIYCSPAQLRHLLLAVRWILGEQLELHLDSVDSCVHSTIPVLNGQRFNVTVPDPGEYERALCDENEMIFTMRAGEMEELMEGMKFFCTKGIGYRELIMQQEADHGRPPFYREMFEKWGLPTGKLWDK